MNTKKRDRASGWKHAKLSGHKNEALVEECLNDKDDFQKCFLYRVKHPYNKITGTCIGGLYETDVTSVNGGKTKSKTDLKVYLDTDEVINVSIKKSTSGQVYLVRAGLFISTFEQQFNTKIPDSVQRAINLFWANADDAIEIIEKYADMSNKTIFDRQIRHRSLNATTLKKYDENLYFDLLNWFKEHSHELAKLSFSMGAVEDCSEWSKYIWYINLLGENDIDDIFSIEEICDAVKKVASKETYYGSTNGGTTIQLPFGFVQWHQKQLQFHHNYDKLCSILKKRKIPVDRELRIILGSYTKKLKDFFKGKDILEVNWSKIEKDNLRIKGIFEQLNKVVLESIKYKDLVCCVWYSLKFNKNRRE